MVKRMILICCLSVVAVWAVAAQHDKDLLRIRQNLYEIALCYSDGYGYDISSLLEKFDLYTGLFTDLNYDDQTNSDWQPGVHWRRLSMLAIAYRAPESAFKADVRLRNVIVRGVEGWTKQPHKAANGWWNLIGVPAEMARVFILMERELGDELIARNLGAMNLAVRPDYYDYYGPATGQNLLWETFNHITASVLVKDVEGLKRALRASCDEIVLTTKEGIQPDYSFHQHGPQSYAFGYGKAFSLTAAQIFYAVNGTSFSIPPAKKSILSGYLLLGQQWCTYRKMAEYTGMGREIARPDDKTLTIVKAARLMSKVDARSEKELTAFADQLETGHRRSPLRGNRYFPYIDFMVHQGGDYFFSVKGASNRIMCTEAGNKENLLGYHLGNGTTFLARTGEEYHGIFPVWNWKRLPGSIAVQDTLPLPVYDWTKGARGNTSFVYGVSNGSEGCFSYDYRRDQIAARRSWYCIDGLVLVLHSGVRFKKDHPVFHTLNQCYLHGEVEVDGRPMGEGSLNKAVQQVWHDSVGYYFPQPQTVFVSALPQTGSWYEINRAGSSTQQQAPVFTLSMDWGKESADKTFSYYIIPNVGKREALEQRCPKVEVLECNDRLHVVYNKSTGTYYITAFAPNTSYELPGKVGTLHFKEPSVCLLSPVDKGWELTIRNELGVKVSRLQNLPFDELIS